MVLPITDKVKKVSETNTVYYNRLTSGSSGLSDRALDLRVKLVMGIEM